MRLTATRSRASFALVMRCLVVIPLLHLAVSASAATAGVGHSGTAVSAPPSRGTSEHGATATSRLGAGRSTILEAVERSVVGVDRAKIDGQPAKVLTVRLNPLTEDAKRRLIQRGFVASLQSGRETWCAHLEGSDGDGWHRLTCIRVVASPATPTR